MSILPSSHNSVGHNVEDVLSIGAVSYYAKLKSEGRAKPGGPLSGVPVGDPGYVAGNAGVIVILHFLVPFLMAVVFAPVCVIGAAPFAALVYALYTLSHVVGIVAAFIAFFVWLKYIVWRLAWCKILWRGILGRLL